MSDAQQNQPLHIVVLGAGAIGSVFGGFLARAGHEVTLVGRPEHMQAVNRHGLRIDGIWGEHLVTGMVAVTDMRRLVSPRFDLALLTVKSHDTAAMVQEFLTVVGEPPPVVSLQNGLGNVETIAGLCGPEKTIGGRVIFGVEYRAPGHVTVTVCADATRIGFPPGAGDRATVVRIAECCTRAGLQTEAVDDIMAWISAKALYNTSLNGLASLLAVPYGRLAEMESTRQIIGEIITEFYSCSVPDGVAMACPTPAAYSRELFSELIPRTAAHHPSMLQDIQRGKPTEVDALNGAVVSRGRAQGVATPCNWAIWKLIHARERIAQTRTAGGDHAGPDPGAD